jgi:uncharacterized membrane protein
MREFLLIVHILSAAAWIGGGLFALTSFPKLASQVGVKEVGHLDESVGSRFFGIAIVLLLLSGIGLVLTSDAFGWSDAFVLTGIGVIVVEGALQGTVFGPKMTEAYESENLNAFRQTFRISGIASLALVILAVWAMVTKIGAG